MHLKGEVRICEKNKRADTKVSGEKGEGGASGNEAEIIYPPAACSADLGEAGALLSSMVEQRSPPAPRGPHGGKHKFPKEAVTLEKPTVKQGKSVRSPPLQKKERERLCVIN